MEEYYLEEEWNAEELEAEWYRLMSIAESYTGAEKLRQKVSNLPMDERVKQVQQFIWQERELREAHLTPYTIDDMKKRIDQQVNRENT